MDFFDRAQETAERMNAQALEAHRKNTTGNNLPSREQCLDCGKPIPARRRELIPGCTRCVRCQELFEDEKLWRG